MSFGLIILCVYIISIMHMHYRGRVRFSAARQFLTHTNYLAPYNLLINLLSSIPNTPILDDEPISGLNLLRENWEEIRDEALNLAEQGDIKAAGSLNDIGFNSFFKKGWKRYYLKWYGEPLNSALEQCPKTIELLEQTPTVRAAMFASLPPGAELAPHRDPFAGSLRYHLGLSTPNSDQCFILVDGERHAWYDGQDVLFDETYIHEAHNNTDDHRIILFCDVARPLRSRLLTHFNTFISATVMRASATCNDERDPVGLINKAFSSLYSIRIISRKIKRWNKPVYQGLKYGLYLVLIYTLFF